MATNSSSLEIYRSTDEAKNLAIFSFYYSVVKRSVTVNYDSVDVEVYNSMVKMSVTGNIVMVFCGEDVISSAS